MLLSYKIIIVYNVNKVVCMKHLFMSSTQDAALFPPVTIETIRTSLLSSTQDAALFPSVTIETIKNILGILCSTQVVTHLLPQQHHSCPTSFLPSTWAAPICYYINKNTIFSVQAAPHYHHDRHYSCPSSTQTFTVTIHQFTHRVCESIYRAFLARTFDGF